MEKIKTITANKRPDDYFISICPQCGNTKTTRVFGGQVNKTTYHCLKAEFDYSVTPYKVNGCNGIFKWIINPKYQ